MSPSVFEGVVLLIEGFFIANVETHTVSNTEVQLHCGPIVKSHPGRDGSEIQLPSVVSRRTAALFGITKDLCGHGEPHEGPGT